MKRFAAVAIIYNPQSTGDAPQNAKELHDALRHQLKNVPIKLLPTQHAGHATELAYQAAQQIGQNKKVLIVSASGDGGYNEVINGALQAQSEGAQPICAVLPSGNANDHARTMQQRPLAQSILDARTTHLDVLRLHVNGPGEQPFSRYAHSYIGLGLTPTVAVELNKHNLNSLKEAWLVLRTFWSLKPVSLRIEGSIHHYDSLICSSIPEMAKVLTLAEHAKPDDGKFELTALPHNHKLRMIGRLFKGVVGSLEARSRQSTLRFTLLQAAPIQLDGEVLSLAAGSEIAISLEPSLLETIV